MFLTQEPNKKSKKRKKGKQKRNKLDEDNNNQLPGIELVAIDTAPDIITAHDSESIYETLDGRRAARANADRETAQNNQSGGSNNNGNPATSANANAADPTYDHLNRYKNRATPRALPEGATFERYTDPVVSPRPKIPQPNPRAVHSSDGVEGREGGGGGRRWGENELAPDPESTAAAANRRNAFGTREPGVLGSPSPEPVFANAADLAELARQSSAGGKRIVCQLTMVGVVENGKPVPVQQRAASNALFLLEPGRDCCAGEATLEEEALRQRPEAKLRIVKKEVSSDDGDDAVFLAADAAGAGAGVVGVANGSEYFILEPLDQLEDLSDLIDTLGSPPSLDGEAGSGCEAGEAADVVINSRDHGSRNSLHGQRCVSSFRGLSEGREERYQSQSFRKSRVHSCPTEAESASGSPQPSLRQTFSYGRSLSSPQSTLQKRLHSEAWPSESKLDAESLEARIQQEMRALGFLTDADSTGQKHEQPASFRPESVSAADDVHGSNLVRPGAKAPRNEYFILEPEADSDEDDVEGNSHPTVMDNPPPSVPAAGTNVSNSSPFSRSQSVPDSCGKIRYHRQQSRGLPPSLPQRHRRTANHTRSRSETPIFRPLPLPQEGSEEEEGPVVVSLKKNTTDSNAASCRLPSSGGKHRDSFRPRLKSESSIVPQRLNME